MFGCYDGFVFFFFFFSSRRRHTRLDGVTEFRRVLFRSGSRLVAVRSPYYVPQFAPEADTAALIRTLDTLGRPVGRLGNAMIPEVPFLADVVNAGAVAVGDDGS